MTNVEVIVGDTTDLNGQVIQDAYNQQTKDPVNGTIRPVAYVPLDQNGNIIPAGSGIGVQEVISRNGGKPETIPPNSLALLHPVAFFMICK